MIRQKTSHKEIKTNYFIHFIQINFSQLMKIYIK